MVRQEPSKTTPQPPMNAGAYEDGGTSEGDMHSMLRQLLQKMDSSTTRIEAKIDG